MRTLGIDVGATYVKWVVLDLSDGPRTVADGSFETRADLGPTAALERLAELGREVAAANAPVDRVGIGMPGPLDLERGRTVFLGNMPGLGGRPDRRAARAPPRPAGRPHQRRAGVHARRARGSARAAVARTLVGFALGTGVGGGVVIDGRLLLGLNGTIGELGHQTVVPDGSPCACGSHGCLETVAAAPAIARAAGMATAEEVVDGRPGRRSRRASPCSSGPARYLGIGIANVVLTIGPERVIVGGGVGEAGDLIIEPARRELARRVTMMPLDRHRDRRGRARHARRRGRSGTLGRPRGRVAARRAPARIDLEPCDERAARMLNAERLHGVIPAIPTPFTADGRAVDEAALRRVVRHVVDGGVHGIMTTGGHR